MLFRSDASEDSWEPIERLAHCEEAIAAFERANAISIPRPPPPPPSQPCGGAAPPIPPSGFTLLLSPPDPLPDLIGRRIFYWWPDDGWQLGTVARQCVRVPFSHVVAYHRSLSALSGTVDTLLDRPAYGTRWFLLEPAAPTGVRRSPRLHPSADTSAGTRPR